MKSKIHALRLCSAVLTAAFLLPVCARAEKPQPDLARGKTVFEQTCARCHGVDGKATVPFAKRFYPRPRDLTSGTFKFRSTVSGSPPTDEDIFKTLQQGLHGSNMPDWNYMDEATRWQVVYYLKTLSPTFKDSQPEPVDLGKDPGAAHADLKKGRAVFEQLGCAACHGAQGRANGMSSAGLVDDWGMPIRPANLTQGWNYRGGSTPKDILIRLLAGIDGAGMPSYTGAVSTEDAWQLAYYVASLQEKPAWNLMVHAGLAHGALPTTIEDARWKSQEWQSIDRTDVWLRHTVESDGSWAEAPTVNKIAFKAVANEDTLVVLLTWDDPTEDAQAGQADSAGLVLRTPGVEGDTISLQVWPFNSPPLDFCFWSADSAKTREMIAPNYEALKTTAGLELAGASRYDDGRWTVLLQRPLKQDGLDHAAQIPEGKLFPVAFVVWDGASPKSRAVSPWVDAIIPDAGAKHGAH